MKNTGAIVKLETRPHRVVARENWGLTAEQMAGMEVHHRVPVSEGGTNDPSNLFVCSPSMHRWGWHDGKAFIGWGAKASEGRDKEEHKETSRRVGHLTAKLGIGVHGMSPEKQKESASKGGKAGGKLPWWHNLRTGEETRAHSCPGHGWERGRNPIVRARMTKKLKPSYVNSQLWEDPDHPEMGAHTPGILVQMQMRRGYPHGKENRVKVGVKLSKEASV